MANFDINLFASVVGRDGNLLDSIQTSFGFPSCLKQLTAEAVALIPRSVLNQVLGSGESAEAKADSALASIYNTFSFRSGVVSYVTKDGRIQFESNSSDLLANTDAKEEVRETNAFLDLLNGLDAAAQVGGNLYRNIESQYQRLQSIKQCLEKFKNIQRFKNGLGADEAAANLTNEQYDSQVAAAYSRYSAQVSAIVAEAAAISNVVSVIRTEIARRELDPDAEPEIDARFANLVSGTSFRVQSTDEDDTGEEIIRLVYGPPETTNGRYILTTDGLYYNSQTDNELEPVLLFISDTSASIGEAEKWKFNFPPNVGGKGDQINSKTFNKWINTVFDENIIDDSEDLQEHYNRDHFLQVLDGQKEKRILDINKQIDNLIESEASLSIIENFKQSLLSEVAYHNSKINRRKKQIEIAFRAPTIFGRGTSPAPGKVPINDFSYLQDCNISLSLNTQKNLILNQEDVSGVVLPLKPTFVVSKSPDATETIEHLIVPEVGIGGIIIDDRDPNDSSSLELAISDVVTTDNLISVYNFLNSKTTIPSSLDFNVLNCKTTDDYNNAQLVAPNAEFVFGKSDQASFGFGYGLGAAYLEGITRNYGIYPSALGSYVKLPDTEEYQDWLYSKSGATFDTWVYAPYLTFDASWDDGLDTSSLYRLILACENTGSLSSVTRSPSEDILNVGYTDGSDFTKGLIMGFTRDLRWRGQSGPTNDGSLQKGEDGGFILAPTIGYDSSSVAFIAKAKAQNTCLNTSGWLGMYVPLTTQTDSGKTLEDCSKGFCQLSLTFNYKTDTVSLFLDSELLSTSSISQVFGSSPTKPINLPTFKKQNSFEYSQDTVGYLAPASLKTGPRLNSYFTPWILGGGYTDGMSKTGNFMGGDYGGVRSGLRGFLGSTKFYSKPLTQKELSFNYSVQSKLYKNLDGVNNEYNIIIAIGQSNIDGVSATYEDPGVPERFRRAQARTKIWMPESFLASAGTWEYLDPVNISNQSYGGYNTTRYELYGDPEPIDPQFRFNFYSHRYYDPVMQFMQRMADDLNDDVYLIKNTKGGTSMLSGLPSPVDLLSWTRNTTLPGFQGYDLYSTLKLDTSAAISALRGPSYAKVTVKAILMMQGEFESGNSTFPGTPYTNPGDMAQEWDQCFTELLYPRLQQDIKESLGTPDAPDIPVIFTKVHSELESVSFPYVSDVQTQQETAAARAELNAYLVDVDGLSFTDGTRVHFNAESLTTIGNKLYDKYKEITE